MSEYLLISYSFFMMVEVHRVGIFVSELKGDYWLLVCGLVGFGLMITIESFKNSMVG